MTTMTDIAYRDVTTTLLQRIPELHNDYETERQSWAPDAVHPHVVYGSILGSYVDRTERAWQTTNDDEHESVLRRVFSLVDELVTSSDFESRCVIEASLLETLLGEPDGWQRFSRFFGKSTLEMAKKVKARFAS